MNTVKRGAKRRWFIAPNNTPDFSEATELQRQRYLFIMDEASIKAHIKRLKEKHEKTGNPLYVLRARQLCRQWKLPISEWVEEYLDDALDGLLAPIIDYKKDDKDERKDKIKALPKKIKKSFGLTSTHYEIYREDTEETIVQRILDLRQQNKRFGKIS